MDKLQTINAALAHLGQARASSLSDTGHACALALEFWDTSLSEVLNSSDWGFARVRTVITPATEVPLFGYSRKYELPSDLVTIHSVNGEAWEQQAQFVSIEGGFLLGNFEPLKLVYTTRLEDVTKWPKPAAALLALRLACNICIQLTNNTGLLASLESKYIKEFNHLATRDSKATSGAQNPYKYAALRNSIIGRARHGGFDAPDFAGDGSAQVVGSFSTSAGGSGTNPPANPSGFVRYDETQGYITNEQKELARMNIDAASVGDLNYYVQNTGAVNQRVTDLENWRGDFADPRFSSIDFTLINQAQRLDELSTSSAGKVDKASTLNTTESAAIPLSSPAAQNLGAASAYAFPVGILVGDSWDATNKIFRSARKSGAQCSLVSTGTTGIYTLNISPTGFPWRDGETSANVILSPAIITNNTGSGTVVPLTIAGSHTATHNAILRASGGSITVSVRNPSGALTALRELDNVYLQIFRNLPV